MFASMLRCVMTTPFGSAVAPDVKMISATSSRVDRRPRADSPSVQSSSCELARPARRRRRRSAARPRRSSTSRAATIAADAREELGRRAVVDRHDDDAAEQAAPERDDPLGPVLAPEDDLVALAEAGGVQARRKAARGAADLVVGVTRGCGIHRRRPGTRRVRARIVKKIDQRVAGHE